jgi:hypothetical protein
MKKLTLILLLSLIIPTIPEVCFAGGQDDDGSSQTYYDAVYLKPNKQFQSNAERGEIISLDDNKINIKANGENQAININRIDFIVYDSNNIENMEKRKNLSLTMESMFKETNVAVVIEEGGNKSLTQRLDSYKMEGQDEKIVYMDIVKYRTYDWPYVTHKTLGRIVEISDTYLIIMSDKRYSSASQFNIPKVRGGMNIYQISEIEAIEFDKGDKDNKEVLKDRLILAEEIERITGINDIEFYIKNVEKAHDHYFYLGMNSRWDIGLFSILYTLLIDDTNYTLISWFNYGQLGIYFGYWNGNEVYGHIGLGHIPIPGFQGESGETYYGEIGIELQRPLILEFVNDYAYLTSMGSLDISYMYMRATETNSETSYIGINAAGGADFRFFNHLSVYVQVIFFIKVAVPKFDFFYLDFAPKIGIRLYI